MFAEGADQSLATIFSLEGLELSDKEKSFFKDANPFGFILFARNCESPSQLKALTSDLKETVGRDCPILIDQEGGRVQRLKPPNWRAYPAAQEFGDTARSDLEKALEELRFNTLQMAEELKDAGINVNCTPVLDVLVPQTHEVIGDRAFSNDPEIVGRLGLSVCRHYLASGVTPVIKHIPGHGRAAADSHLVQPHVTASLEQIQGTDFVPFKQVAASDVGKSVWAMAAHIIYDELDAEYASSISQTIVQDIIRKDIGFEGILLGDDLDMKALETYGDMAERARLTIEAGCDLALYCPGKLVDMEKIAESVPKVGPETLQRLQNSTEFTKLAS